MRSCAERVALSRLGLVALAIGLLAFGVPQTAMASVIEAQPAIGFGMPGIGNVSLPGGLIQQVAPDVWMIGTGGTVQVFDASNQLVADVSIDAIIHTDPFIQYGVAVTNHTNVVQTFTFDFSSPISGGPFASALSSFSASYTDAYLWDGVTIGLPAGNSFLQVATVSPPFAQNLGVDIGTPCSHDASSPHSGACTYADVITSFPAANYNFLDVKLSFTLTPHDTATLNGLVVVNPIPEPATAGLIASAILALACARRRSLRA